MKRFYIIDFLGYFGPQLLFFLTLYLLYSTKTYLIVYIIAIIFNSLLNFVIKGIIKQPRPKEDLDVFNPEKKHIIIVLPQNIHDRFMHQPGCASNAKT